MVLSYWEGKKDYEVMINPITLRVNEKEPKEIRALK